MQSNIIPFDLSREIIDTKNDIFLSQSINMRHFRKVGMPKIQPRATKWLKVMMLEIEFFTAPIMKLELIFRFLASIKIPGLNRTSFKK